MKKIFILLLLPYGMGWACIYILSLLGNLGEPIVPLFSIAGTVLIWILGGMVTMALSILRCKILWCKIR
jgi:hypothetical protein